MLSCEPFISPQSDYYISMPGKNAREMFFYPLCTGRFEYLPGYSLQRESYDSFLLLYLEKGSMTLALESLNRTIHAPQGSFLLLDCYRPHAYSTDSGCLALWCHFDGPTARAFYQAVTDRLGNVFSLTDPYPVLNKLQAIYNIFRTGEAVREPLLSKFLNDILTALLLYAPETPGAPSGHTVMEDIVSYINEHFAEELTVETLAHRAALSQYHFIRVFKRETGFTPHEYIVNIRVNTAKYLLKNSALPVKDICFQTGFSCESVFCSAFKRHLGMTPLEYREDMLQH